MTPEPIPAARPFDLTRPVALVGLMGVGKTTVGRRLAAALEVPFADADAEVERAGRRTVTEIFTDLGEAAFREGERRVIARLLKEPPHVLATGGGAFAHAETRAVLRAGATIVWLKADLPILARRIARKDTRPLVRGRDPLEVLEGQARERYAAFAEAHVVVETGDVNHATTTQQVLSALGAYLAEAAA